MITKTKIKTFFKSDNFRSFVHTIVTDVLYDAAIGAAIGHIVTDGDISKQSLFIFGYALFRTACRAFVSWLKLKFPKPT